MAFHFKRALHGLWPGLCLLLLSCATPGSNPGLAKPGGATSGTAVAGGHGTASSAQGEVAPGHAAPAVAPGPVSVEPATLPLGVRTVSEEEVMLLIPWTLPPVEFQRLTAPEVRPVLRTFLALGLRPGVPLRLGESERSVLSKTGLTGGFEALLAEEFRATFGDGQLSMPTSQGLHRMMEALQRTPRYMGPGFRDAAIELFSSPAFLASVGFSVVVYFSAWLAPEPLFSKAFAATLTARLALLVGLAELARVAHVLLTLYHESQAARTDEELEAAAAHCGAAAGATLLRVTVAVASMGLARLLPAVPPGEVPLLRPSFPPAAPGPSLAAALPVVSSAALVSNGVLVLTGAQVGTGLSSACGPLNLCAKSSASPGPKLSTRYGPPHTRSNPPHNEAIEDELSRREAAGDTGLRKNKAQIKADGKRVFKSPSAKGPQFRRPDASFLRADGVRHNINYVSNPRDLARELEAFDALIDADRSAIHELFMLNGQLVRRYVPLGVRYP